MDLGVCFDNELKFGTHIGNAVNKANQLVGLIRRTFTHNDKEMVKRMYTSIVRPHLEYGNIIWYPQLKKDVNLIERVQRRVTKLIPELQSLNYETRLRELNLPTLVNRRYRGDAIEAH